MTKRSSLRLRIPPGRSPERLDRALARELAGEESRSSVARLIRDGRVLLNGRPARPASEVVSGDEVAIDRPEPEPTSLTAEDLEFGIVFEDSAIVVVDKPAGMVTHPAAGAHSGTLVNALLHRIHDLSGVGGVLRPGIVHRLDKGTTGLLVVAKNDEAHRALAAQLAERTLKRVYRAIAWGRVSPASFVIDAPIARHPRDRKRMAVVEGGKEARTHVRVQHATDLASLLEVELETGRTHQIRVHLQNAGHPLVGDATYGGRRRAIRTAAPEIRRAADALVREIDRPALHAYRLRLIHPVTKEPREFESPVPEDLRRVAAIVGAAGGGEIG